MKWSTIRTKKAPKMRVIIYDDELLFSEAPGSLLAMRGLEVMGFPTTSEGELRMVQTVPAHASLVKMPPGRSVSPLGIALFKRLALPMMQIVSDP